MVLIVKSGMECRNSKMNGYEITIKIHQTETFLTLLSGLRKVPICLQEP